MEFTEVIMRQHQKPDADEPSKLKAIFSLVIDNEEFTVHNVKLIKGQERWFIAMPSEVVSKEGSTKKRFRDVAHPIGPVNRQKTELAVFEQYEEQMIWRYWLTGDEYYAQELAEISEQLERFQTGRQT